MSTLSGMSKYRNTPTTVDGIRFDSKKEAYRYGTLKLLLAAGSIRDLEIHPPYPLVVNGVKVGRYVADFRYTDVGTGKQVVEDVKGVRTAVYKLKKKLVAALHGIDVVEI